MIATRPETAIVPAKNSAGTTVPDTAVIDQDDDARGLVDHVVGGTTTRSVSPARDDLGRCVHDWRGPVIHGPDAD
jgi:hypothetical protein